jgi:hypothetical protein
MQYQGQNPVLDKMAGLKGVCEFEDCVNTAK